MKSQKNSRGFTLLELLITVFAIFFLVLAIGGVAGSCAGGCTNQRQTAALTARESREYASTMHPNWTAIRTLCADTDTDRNGYVTCQIGGTIRDPSGATRDVQESIECPDYALIGPQRHGCKPYIPRLSLPQQNSQ